MAGVAHPVGARAPPRLLGRDAALDLQQARRTFALVNCLFLASFLELTSSLQMLHSSSLSSLLSRRTLRRATSASTSADRAAILTTCVSSSLSLSRATLPSCSLHRIKQNRFMSV